MENFLEFLTALTRETIGPHWPEWSLMVIYSAVVAFTYWKQQTKSWQVLKEKAYDLAMLGRTELNFGHQHGCVGVVAVRLGNLQATNLGGVKSLNTDVLEETEKVWKFRWIIEIGNFSLLPIVWYGSFIFIVAVIFVPGTEMWIGIGLVLIVTPIWNGRRIGSNIDRQLNDLGTKTEGLRESFSNEIERQSRGLYFIGEIN